MNIKLLVILSIFCLSSCSNLSKNMVKKGDFYINNGRGNSEVWKEDLKLTRVSWYTELTLLFDTMYGEIKDSSKFTNWFSKDEQRRLASCEKKLLTVNYSLDDRISHQMFENSLKQSGYEKVVAQNFEQSLRSHPDFSEHILSLYKINIFCAKRSSTKIMVSFPSFDEIVL